MILAVEFGSRSRGDYDCFSDRDVLLLAEDWSVLKKERDDRKGLRHSVTCFSFDRARYLVSRGSLFFKHIMEEGVLVNGSQEEFRYLLSSWSPAASYLNEIEANIDVLELLHFVPLSPNGYAVALDILITVVRSVLIRKLAEQGVYEFSWFGLLNHAATMGLIKPENQGLFLLARKIKNTHRNGGRPRVRPGYVERVLNASSHILQRRSRICVALPKDLSRLPEKCKEGSYKQLRAIELLCAGYSCDKSLDGLRVQAKDPAYFTLCSRLRSGQ